jgi:hypothetical protein
LQRDVEVVLESSNNNNFVGSVIHPQGNIAEALLKEGMAKCVDWSIAKVLLSFLAEGLGKICHRALIHRPVPALKAVSFKTSCLTLEFIF